MMVLVYASTPCCVVRSRGVGVGVGVSVAVGAVGGTAVAVGAAAFDGVGCTDEKIAIKCRREQNKYKKHRILPVFSSIPYL